MFLSFPLVLNNCSFTSRGGLYVFNGTVNDQLQSSTVDIQGTAYLASDASMGFAFNSNVTLSGNLQLSSARFLLAASTLDIRGGGILFSDCVAPSLQDVLSLRIENHTSCMVLIFEGTLRTSGDLILESAATLYMFGSNANLGGVIYIGRGSFFASLETIMRNTGQFFVTAGSVVFRDSQYTLEGGSLQLANSSSALFSRTTTNIVSGFFETLSFSTVLVESGTINIIGGDLRIRSLASLEDFLAFANAGTETPALYMTANAQINLLSGSVLLQSGNMINMRNGSRLNIRGGDMTMQNASYLVAQNGALTIDGGNFLVPGGLIFIQTRSQINLTAGDIRLSSHSAIFVLDHSSLVLKGSVFIEHGSSILLNISSTMRVDGGSIDMDNTSFLQIDGNSSISGVGAIKGRVYVQTGTITYSAAAATNLSVTTLTQTNQSRYEVVLSTAYGSSGASTQVYATGNITLGGSLTVVVDPTMLQRLLGGEEVVIMSTTEGDGLSGTFSTVSIDAGGNYSCAAKIKTTAKSLAVVFDLSLCQSQPGEISTPTSFAEISSSSAGIIAGVVVAIVAVLIIAAVVVILTVPRVRKAVMPWREAREQKPVAESELEESKPASDRSGRKSWTVTKPTGNM
jgi:hypothetical protein